MESIGTIFKNARNALSKSLEEVHQETKVSISHLRLLEEDNFTFLPETYVKSFLKTYSKCLGLNVDDILQKYNDLKKVEEPVIVEEVEPEQQSLVKTEKTVVSKPKIKMPELPVREKVLEWALGLGTFFLLISLGFAYFQYRAQIYARPVDGVTVTQTEEYVEMADVALSKPQTDGSGSIISPLELEVTARKKIWLQVKVDNKKVSEYTLSPAENLVWIAKDRFDIQIKQVIKRENPELPQSEDEVVRLSFAIDDTRQE